MNPNRVNLLHAFHNSYLLQFSSKYLANVAHDIRRVTLAPCTAAPAAATAAHGVLWNSCTVLIMKARAGKVMVMMVMFRRIP